MKVQLQSGVGMGYVPWAFNTAAVAAWREGLARAETTGTADAGLDELRRRKLAAETLQAELTLALARKEVAPVEEFERAMIDAFAKVRSRMRTLPSKVSLSLLGLTNEATIRAILSKEIDAALRALGNEGRAAAAHADQATKELEHDP